MKEEKLIVCTYKHKDCFAYKSGECNALQDCDFGEKECPFYKKKDKTNN